MFPTDRFQIQRRLGAGGMGVVYQAYDREQDAVVALKILRALDEHSLYRFKKEFRSLVDLHHPNLVRLGELFCENERWFFTMELLHGLPLLEHVGQAGRDRARPRPRAETLTSRALRALALPGAGGRRFDEGRLRTALCQLARGLLALHEAQKVHRDIKPSNILVTTSGRTVLLDFGLVAEMEDGLQRSDVQIIGTVPYMAPEQAAGLPVGWESDWYSLGAVLYEALTGTTPFGGTVPFVLAAKQQGDPVPPNRLCRHVPSDLAALCMDLLQRDPARRPSGREVLVRLGAPEPARAAAFERTDSSHGTSVPFVGRAEELAALEQAFRESCAGGPVVAFVHGESGLGKSALVHRFLQRLALARPDMVALSSRCFERETVPFKAFDGIIDALSHRLGRLDPLLAARLVPRDTSALVKLFPALQRVPAMTALVEPPVATSNPQQLRARAFSALRELLGKLAQSRPVVLFIDDFQWADADSRALLSEVHLHAEAPALLLVATVRSSADALPAGPIRCLALGRLPPEDARTLARALLESTALDGPAIAPGLAEEAGGHPLFIVELARHLALAGMSGPNVSLDDLVAARIDGLEEPARRLLEVVALAGQPLSRQVAVEAAQVEPQDASGHVTSLAALRLLRAARAGGEQALEAYHDRIREAVVVRLDAERRKSHHERLAEALERAGTAGRDPLVLVRHLEAAGRGLRAAELAVRAARRAAETLAFDQAAELYRTAFRLSPPSHALERQHRLALAEALANAGRGAEAAEAYLQAAPGATAADQLECWRRAAEQLLTSGQIERGLEVLETVLGLIGARLPSSSGGALISLLWHRARLRLRGLRWQCRDESEIAPADLVRVETYKAASVGLALVDTIYGSDFGARSLLYALRCGEPRRIARALATEAMYVAAQGCRGARRAHQLVAEVTRIAAPREDPFLLGWRTGTLGIVAYLLGQFRVARDNLREAETIFRNQTNGTAWELDSVRAFLLFSLRRMGSMGDLRHFRQDYLGDDRRRGDLYGGALHTLASNIVWLAEDAPQAALADLETATWWPPGPRFHLQHWQDLRARVEIALYCGRPPDPHELRLFDVLGRSLLLRVQAVRTETHWMQARLALQQIEREGDRAAVLRRAARLARWLERERVGYATVWARLVRAALAVQAREPARAIAELEIAILEGESLDLGLCVAAARRRHGELLGGPTGRALVDRADAWMREEHIRNPERMTEVVAPGFA